MLAGAPYVGAVGMGVTAGGIPITGAGRFGIGVTGVTAPLGFAEPDMIISQTDGLLLI